MKLLLFILLLFSLAYTSYARQKPAADTGSIKISKAPAADSDSAYVDPASGNESIKFLSKREFWFGIATLVVLLILTPIIINLVRKKNINDELAVKLIITTIVIIATLFLVVAGYDDKTIAPAFGLFGGVLGYVFGRGSGGSSSDTTNTTNSNTP